MSREPERHDEGAAEGDAAGEGAPSRGLSRRAKIVMTVLGVVVVAALLGWYVRYQAHGKFLQSTDDARLAADAVAVAPRINGYVAAVLVADNQDVVAGQPLVRIDPRDYRAQAAQAEAQIAIAGAQIDGIRAQIGEQGAMIEQSRAQAAAAQARAASDAAEVARYAPLAASGAETREKLAQLRSTAIQSANEARRQQAALVMQQRHVASLLSQVRQGEAQGNAARAQLQAADVNLNATVIRASMAGRVGDRNVVLGQYAQAGTRLMSIVPLDDIYVVANFKETQLALMRVGQPATIAVDALAGTELHGRVVSLSPGTGSQFSLLPPQNATGNFTKITQRVPVRVALAATPAARRLLVPGMSVTVTVDTVSARGELDRIRQEQAGPTGRSR